MRLSDEELIEGYKMGNASCLEEIFGRYKKPIFNYALRLLANRADSEEAVSEAFYILTSKKDRYTPDPKAKFSTWLYRIAHNVCVDLLRKRNRIVFMWSKRDKDSDNEEQWDIPDTKDLPDQAAQKSDRALAVKHALAKLPLEMKEALVLREYQQLSYEDIAGVLNCTLEKVKILIFRAREKLRIELLPFIKEAGHE